MILKYRSYPRAALIGNPSDGYYGKTIAFVFTDFHAEVTLYESPDLQIMPSERDHSTFRSLEHVFHDVKTYGYYGGIRLLKAAVKLFYEYCRDHDIAPDRNNFTLRYHSTIPHRLGLAGSSAIITAAVRAMAAFYGLEIPVHSFANLVLAVEKDELLIGAGLQDRVAQAFDGGLIAMDFNRELMETRGYGRYTRLPVSTIPNFYLAYRTDLAEGSEVTHGRLAHRYRSGDKRVLAAIEEWSSLTDRFAAALKTGNTELLGPLMNRNFDLRAEVCRISPGNRTMVETARGTGASAKFTGSGGAIIGTYSDDAMYLRLQKAMRENKVAVIKPHVKM